MPWYVLDNQSAARIKMFAHVTNISADEAIGIAVNAFMDAEGDIVIEMAECGPHLPLVKRVPA